MPEYSMFTQHAIIDDIGTRKDNIRVRVYDSYTFDIHDGKSVLYNTYLFGTQPEALAFLKEETIKEIDNWC